MRIAVRHPFWPRLPPITIDATAAVTQATSVVIAGTRNSRTSMLMVHGRVLLHSRRSRLACRRRVLLMSTQSYLVTLVRRITSVESEKMTRDTRTAIVTHEWSRSIGRRSETDPPLHRGRRLRPLGVSTDPQTRPIARLQGAVVSAYDLLCSHAHHNLPAPYVNATILITTRYTVNAAYRWAMASM